MKIIVNSITGKAMIDGVYDKDWFSDSTRVKLGSPLDSFIYEIDEVDPGNAVLCKELAEGFSTHRRNANNEPKYYWYDNAGTWELWEIDGWAEEVQGSV